MKGNQIIVTSEPKGTFREGTLSTSGTPKPGSIMQRKASVAADANGRFTWTEAAPGGDGQRPRGAIAVLLEKGEGYTYADAYANGEHCFLYEPAVGEELNVLWSAAGTGTGDAVAVGDPAIIDNASGLLIDTTGSPECEPFIAMEAVSDVTAAGTLVWSQFAGY